MSAISRAVLFLLACFALIPLDAAAWDRGRVERFASLPEGSPNPEGITTDSNGDVYVPGFAPTAPSGPGKLFVFDEDGELLRSLNVTGSSPALLGLAFHPTNRLANGRRQLLIIDFGAGNVLSVDPVTGAATVFAEIKGGGLNALTFDATGKVVAKLGDFDGVRDGSPVGLLFPASLVRRGEWIYITNLSLDLRPITGQQSVDSQWAARVKTHTISRIRFRIPGNDRNAD